MAIGDLVTLPYQFERSGILFGAFTGMEHMSTAGLGMPDVRRSDVVRPRDHGMIPGTNFLPGRTVDINLQVIGTSAADLDAKLAQVASAGADVGLTEAPLVFLLPGESKRRINCRMTKRAVLVDGDYTFGKALVYLEFFATDPRLYDNVLTSQALTLPSSSGGLAWPLGWPLGWGTVVSGLVNVTNSGTFPTRPVVTFIGPLTSPSIQNVTTGLTWASNFDLQSGDQLVVDFDARTVLLNGTASRYSTVLATSTWWELLAGVNQLRLGASAGTGTATVVFRSAWI